MTKSPARELLEQAAETGRMPGREELTAALPSVSSRSAREGDLNKLRLALRKVVALRSDDSAADDPEAEIATIIDDCDDGLSGGLSRTLADEIGARRSDGSADRERRRQANIAKMKQRDPLVELLRLAGPSEGIDPRDLHGLVLRAGLSAEQQQQWRALVEKAGERVARLYAAGNRGDSRDLADKLSEELAGSLAPVPQHRDPLADETDPRALADAIRNRQQLGG